MRVHIAQKVFSRLVFEALTGPIWWYTAGFLRVIAWWRASATRYWHTLSVGLWARNILVPMYGQYDWWGRVISFLIRLVQVIARSMWFAVYMFVLSCAVMVWLLAPVTVLYFLFAPLFLAP